MSVDLTATEKEFRQMQLEAIAAGHPAPTVGSFAFAQSERGIRQRASELGLCAAPEPEDDWRAELEALAMELEEPADGSVTLRWLEELMSLEPKEF